MPVDLSMDPHSVPPELKKEGPDWFAIFTQAGGEGRDGQKKRALDVQLVHTLMHERWVAICLGDSNITLKCVRRIVLCAVCASLRTASTWRLAATERHKSTTRRLG